MPRVPVYERTETIKNTPQPYFHDSAAEANAFGAGAAKAYQGLGDSIEKFGDQQAKNAVKLQEEANQTAAKDLFVAAETEKAGAQTEFQSLEGSNAVNGVKPYTEKLWDIYEKYGNQAPNAAVRKTFQNDFARRTVYSITDAARYAAGQNKVYNRQSRDNEIKLMQTSAAANADDDGLFADSLQRIVAAEQWKAKDAGLPPEAQQQAISLETGKAWVNRLGIIAMADPFRANRLYQENKHNIAGDFHLPIEKTLQQQYNNVGTRTRADQIAAGTVGVKVNAAKPDSFWGNPDDPNFASERLTQIKTSKGQEVTVHKEAAKDIQGFVNELEGMGYDIKSIGGYSKRNIAGTNVASQHSFGNAIDINPNANPVTFGRGKTDLPENISEIAAKYNLSWGGDWKGGKKDTMHFEWSGRTLQPLTPDSPPEWLTRAQEVAKDVARRDAPDNPAYEDLLLSRVGAEYNRVKTAKKEEYRGNANIVQAAVLGDGVNNIKNMNQIFNDPQLNQSFIKLEPGDQKKIISAVEKNAKGDVPQTPDRDAKFRELMGKSITDPEAFAKIQVADEDITNANKSRIFSAQMANQKKIQDNSHVHAALRDPSVASMLNDAKIFLSREDKTANTRYNQFVGAYSLALTQYQDKEKKPAPPEEQRKIASQLLQETTKNYFSRNSRAYEVPNGNAEGQRDWIIENFKTRVGRPPDETEIQMVHQRWKAKQPAKDAQ